MQRDEFVTAATEAIGSVWQTKTASDGYPSISAQEPDEIAVRVWPVVAPLAARVADLTAAIKAAPHDTKCLLQACSLGHLCGADHTTCTCWKRDTIAAVADNAEVDAKRRDVLALVTSDVDDPCEGWEVPGENV